jgi:hypothetical protein
VTASFAFAQLPSPTVRYALETYHDEVIAKLGGSGLDDWVRTTGSVANSAAGHFALAPAGGVSAGQYLLARLSGERLVASGSTLRRGAIVVCSGYSIGRVLERLAQRGLRAEAVGQLASRDVRGQSAAGRHVFSTSA